MTRATLTALILPMAATAGWGYIEPVEREQSALTLPRLLLHFPEAVALVEVARVDLERGAVRFRLVERIAGQGGPEEIRCSLAVEGKVPPELRGLKVGQQAVVFGEDGEGQSLVYLEGIWVHAHSSEDSWRRLTGLRPLYLRCYAGPIPALAGAVKRLRLGRDAVVAVQRPEGGADTTLVRYSMKDPHRKLPAEAPPKEAAPEVLPTGADLERLARRQWDRDLQAAQRRLAALAAEGRSEGEEARELRREIQKRRQEAGEAPAGLRALLAEAAEVAGLAEVDLPEAGVPARAQAEIARLLELRRRLDIRLDQLAGRIAKEEGKERERLVAEFKEAAGEFVAAKAGLLRQLLGLLEPAAAELRRQAEALERDRAGAAEEVLRRRTKGR